MVVNYSHNTEFVTFSRKIFTVIFVCIYLKAFFLKKKEKEKDNCLIFEIKKTNKKAFSKLQSFWEDNRISNENFWKYFANLLSCKKIFMVRTSLFWFFFFYYGL